MSGPINGQPGAHQQPTRWGRTEAGQFADYSYEGDKASIQALAGYFDSTGAVYQVSESFGKSRLDVRLEYNPQAVEIPVDLWEYVGVKVEKDLLESDVPSGITATLSQKNISVIRAAIQNPPTGDESGDFSSTHPNAPVTLASFSDGNAANALTIYNLMHAGVKSAPARAPVLRHTQTVSRNWTIPASLTNVGRIISTASMAFFEGVPTGLLFNLPTLVPATFQIITVRYGWLKNDPTIQQIAFRKWQIVQEWEYGLWPTATFGNPL